MSEKTVVQGSVETFGGQGGFGRGLLAEDVMFYGTLSWGRQRRRAPIAFADEFHEGNPTLRVALHDEFCSADGSRGSMRAALRFDGAGPFFGKESSIKKGVSIETFTMGSRDGTIPELTQGGNAPTLGYVEVVDLGLPSPTDTPDPRPETTSASAGSGAERTDGGGTDGHRVHPLQRPRGAARRL